MLEKQEDAAQLLHDHERIYQELADGNTD
ncbi:MAG TPA: hypothetical protein DIW48_01100, partial [Sphaerochaeta sp.]|nr:hypothetical protein [Sphaerochaeta sp.]